MNLLQAAEQFVVVASLHGLGEAPFERSRLQEFRDCLNVAVISGLRQTQVETSAFLHRLEGVGPMPRDDHQRHDAVGDQDQRERAYR